MIVLGISSSPDYPTSANAFDNTFNLGTTIFNRVLNTNDQWDIVLTRLSPNGGQLVGSTFLGGSGNDGLNVPKQSGGPLVVNYGDEMRGDVITDETGHVYISSVTSSNDFPIVNGFDNSFNGSTTDGLIVKLAPDLSSIVWSSYLGGSGFDAAYSIKFDNDKNIVLAGGTTSARFSGNGRLLSNGFQRHCRRLDCPTGCRWKRNHECHIHRHRIVRPGLLCRPECQWKCVLLWTDSRPHANNIRGLQKCKQRTVFAKIFS